MKVTELLNRYKLKTRQAIDEIGIVELINQKSGVDNREKITTGQVIKALILRSGVQVVIFAVRLLTVKGVYL